MYYLLFHYLSMILTFFFILIFLREYVKEREVVCMNLGSEEPKMESEREEP